MQNRGLHVVEFGVGIPFGSVFPGPRISFVSKKGRFAGIRFSLYLLTWVVGAFVREESEQKFNDLPYKDKALIYCAGPFANIQFGCALFLLWAIVSVAIFPPEGMGAFTTFDWADFIRRVVVHNTVVWVSLITIPVLWFGRKWISTYICQVAGLVLLVWVIHFIAEMGFSLFASSLVGPIGAVKVISGLEFDLPSIIRLAGKFSIFLGAANLLPIPPMDGGMLVMPGLQAMLPRFARWYYKFGVVFLFSTMIAIFSKDILQYLGAEALAILLSSVFVMIFINLRR
jgi:membrane-associated protease RseP (regulator of RpoE activity)